MGQEPLCQNKCGSLLLESKERAPGAQEHFINHFLDEASVSPLSYMERETDEPKCKCFFHQLFLPVISNAQSRGAAEAASLSFRHTDTCSA